LGRLRVALLDLVRLRGMESAGLVSHNPPATRV
jgi:hypothetical protein